MDGRSNQHRRRRATRETRATAAAADAPRLHPSIPPSAQTKTPSDFVTLVLPKERGGLATKTPHLPDKIISIDPAWLVVAASNDYKPARGPSAPSAKNDRKTNTAKEKLSAGMETHGTGHAAKGKIQLFAGIFRPSP